MSAKPCGLPFFAIIQPKRGNTHSPKFLIDHPAIILRLVLSVDHCNNSIRFQSHSFGIRFFAFTAE